MVFNFMLDKIIKVGPIEKSNIEYSVMTQLLSDINNFIEKNNLKEYQISAEAIDFCKKHNKRPIKPIFVDIFSDDVVFIKFIKSIKSVDYLIYLKDLNLKQSYNKKYEKYISSLYKYILKNINNGYIYAQLLFDLKEIVEYLKAVGYSLSTLFNIRKIYEELCISLDYNLNT